VKYKQFKLEKQCKVYFCPILCLESWAGMASQQMAERRIKSPNSFRKSIFFIITSQLETNIKTQKNMFQLKKSKKF
jgi:hypothetical protein